MSSEKKNGFVSIVEKKKKNGESEEGIPVSIPFSTEEELSDVFELSESHIFLIDEETEEIRPDLTVWSALKESYEEELRKLDKEDRQNKIRLLYELGRIEEEVFRDFAAALSYYRKAGKIDEASNAVLSALRRRYLLSNTPREAIKTLESSATTAPDEIARATFFERIGRLYKDRLTDNKQALQAFQKALELDSSYQTALWSLIDLYRITSDPKKQSKTIVQLANVTRDPDFKAVLLAEAGFIQLFSLKDSTKAGELLGLALKANPHNEGARFCLELILYQDGRWSDLADLFIQQGDLAPGIDLNFSNRYLAGSLVWSRLKDTDRAIELFEQAAALKQNNLLPLWELVELYGDTGQWENLCHTLERILSLTQSIDSPRYLAALHFRIGSVLQVRLNRREEAKERFRKALEASPADVPARRALAAELVREKNWEELCGLLQIEAEIHQDPQRRAAVILRQAEITEYELCDPKKAIEIYELAHSLQQNRGPAFRALDRLYTIREEWEKLCDLYRSEVENSNDQSRRVSLKKRMAELLEQRLNRQEEAVEILESIREQVGEDREVHLSLSRIYEKLQRWEQLVESLETESGLSKDNEEKCSLLCHAATILEGRLDDDIKALDLYEKVLQIDGAHQEALSRLGRLYHRKARWNKLVEVYRKEVSASQSHSDAADLLFRVGQILENKMADKNGAISAYKEALKYESGHVPAQDALSDLLRKSGRWKDFLELLDRQAEGGNRTRVALSNLRAGKILEDRLGNLDGAIERIKKALTVEEAESVAHLTLERLYPIKKEFKELAGHLSSHGEGGGWWDPVRVGLRVVAVYRHYINDPVRATQWCEKVLKRDTHNTEAWANEVEVLKRSNQGQLPHKLQKLSGVLSDPQSAGAVLKDRKTWAGMKQGEKEPLPEAVVSGKILEVLPGDNEALETLERIAIEGRNDPALSEVLRQKLEVSTHDIEETTVLLLRMGDVLWRMGKVENAAGFYEKAVNINPTDLPALRSLRVLHQLKGDQEKVAELLIRESEVSNNIEAVTSALMKAGDIWLIEFMDPAKAEAAYARVFEKVPTHNLAFQRLCSLVASRDGYEDLANIYKKKLSTLEGTQRLEVLSDLADLYRLNLGDNTRAISVLEEMLSIKETNEKALVDLSELYAESRRWREASKILTKLEKISQDSERKLSLKLKHISILKDHLHEDEKALSHCHEILQTKRDNTKVLEYAAELELKLGKWEEAALHLSDLADNAQPVDRARFLIQLAKVRERGLDDKNKAQEHLIRAAALCLLAPGAIKNLEEFFEEREDFEGYENLLSRVIQEAGADRPGSTALRLSKARNLFHRLKQRDKAEREVQIALEKDPDSLDTRLELAYLHLMGSRIGLAKAEYQAVLKKDPFSFNGYRGLKEVFLKRDERDRARLAAQAIVLFGNADKQEMALAEEGIRVFEEAPVVLGIMNADHIAQFMAPEEEPAAGRDLLKVLSPHLHLMFPQDLLSRGLSNLKDLPPTHGRYEIIQRVSRRLGIEKYRVFINETVPNMIMAAPGQVPALILGTAVLKSTEVRAFTFEVARNLSLVTTGAIYLKWADLKELEKLLAGVVCQFDKGYGEHIAPQFELSDLGKNFIKGVPRRVRKSFEEPAILFSRAGAIGMSSWKDAVERCGDRVGLCLCGSLEAAIVGMHGRNASKEEIASLLLYNVSPHLAEARKICGVGL